MIQIDRSTITAQGSALLNSGNPISITSVKTGSGTYTAEEDLASRTALKNVEYSYSPSSVDVDGATRTVNAIISNYDPVTEQAIVTTSYTITEIGLYATVGGVEQLFAIGISYSGAYMPAYTGTNKAEMVLAWQMEVSGDQELNVVSAGAAALASDVAATVIVLSGNFAPAFSTSSTYAVGALVTYNNALYRCTTAVSTAGAWDSTKWTATTVKDELALKANTSSLGTSAAMNAATSVTDTDATVATPGAVYDYTRPVIITADGTTAPADTRALWVFPSS